MAISITTIAELKQLVDRELGGTDADNPIEVTLANDLDFSELDESDTLKYAFNGYSTTTLYMNFDGNGHEIKHLAFTDTTATWSLFGYVGGTIQNLTLSDINVQATGSYGIGYLNKASSLIKNCHVSGYINTTGLQAAAIGHLYQNSTMIEVCSFTGTIITSSGFNGIISRRGTNVSQRIRYCWGRGTITVTGSNAVVIFGSNIYENCHFIGELKCTGSYWPWYFSPSSSISANAVRFCYLILTNPEEPQSKGIAHNIFPAGYNANAPSFYNNDVYDYGNGTGGTSAANIKSAAFLRSQGWSA